jgi:hypothetical protein
MLLTNFINEIYKFIIPMYSLQTKKYHFLNHILLITLYINN